MTATGSVPFLRLEGDSYDIGRQHGEGRAAQLRAFLDDGLCRLNHILDKPISLGSLGPTIDAYDAEIASAAPEFNDEIAGLAAGAGISRHEAVLLQIRREVLGYRKIPTRGDCTTYARSGPDPVLAQTIDLNGNVEDQIAVLEITRTASPRRVMVVSFAGLLGYLGVNSDGLAIGLNLLLGGTWRPGLPPYLAIRYLLDHAADVTEAIALLGGLRLASSRGLMLCDAATTAYVEIQGDGQRLAYGTESSHTNHYLDPDFSPFDELNVFARNSSVQRLQKCQAGLSGLPRPAEVEVEVEVEDHFRLLSPAPIYVKNSGDIRRECTVATVVMLPARGELHVRTDHAEIDAVLDRSSQTVP